MIYSKIILYHKKVDNRSDFKLPKNIHVYHFKHTHTQFVRLRNINLSTTYYNISVY